MSHQKLNEEIQHIALYEGGSVHLHLIDIIQRFEKLIEEGDRGGAEELLKTVKSSGHHNLASEMANDILCEFGPAINQEL